jgi:hypothetical protein
MAPSNECAVIALCRENGKRVAKDVNDVAVRMFLGDSADFVIEAAARGDETAKKRLAEALRSKFLGDKAARMGRDVRLSRLGEQLKKNQAKFRAHVRKPKSSSPRTRGPTTQAAA